MTATVVIHDADYVLFTSIRKQIHDANPCLLTYESYDKDTKRAVFTFNSSTNIPSELRPYQINMELPMSINLRDIKLPAPRH